MRRKTRATSARAGSRREGHRAPRARGRAAGRAAVLSQGRAAGSTRSAGRLAQLAQDLVADRAGVVGVAARRHDEAARRHEVVAVVAGDVGAGDLDGDAVDRDARAPPPRRGPRARGRPRCAARRPRRRSRAARRRAPRRGASSPAPDRLGRGGVRELPGAGQGADRRRERAARRRGSSTSVQGDRHRLARPRPDHCTTATAMRPSTIASATVGIEEGVGEAVDLQPVLDRHDRVRDVGGEDDGGVAGPLRGAGEGGAGQEGGEEQRAHERDAARAAGDRSSHEAEGGKVQASVARCLRTPPEGATPQDF